jgi:hypothetical protein
MFLSSDPGKQPTQTINGKSWIYPWNLASRNLGFTRAGFSEAAQGVMYGQHTLF